MTFLESLAEKRQKFLDGLDANEGAINLGIFEDFYPDEAHFIYELLQNAEDAGAHEVLFELTANTCVFEHDGDRHFNERDIDSITGIFNSSKKDNPDKIGKFGVGFKSVFVYTDSPHIYSRDFSFRIVRFVLPQPIQAKEALKECTRFEFPFNKPGKSAAEAWSEIKTGLEQLSETTLLFLNRLRYIKWKVDDQEGAIYRDEHSAAHIEVLRQVDGEEIQSSHWLRFGEPVEDIQRFTAPVEGVERQRVAIAYRLEFLGDQKTFDSKRQLSKQLKIAAVTRGKVSVFFPAEKETSNLRYHLHAPFVPELSRASIKTSQENLPLFEQLGRLSAGSLHGIKELGLLTGEFLSVLPNNDDQLPERYKVIRKLLIDEMRSAPLVPTFAGQHEPASRLVQARASMKSLLSDEDLAFVTGREDSPSWAIGATQKNSNQDRFLTSLGIPEWDAEDLQALFESRVRDTQYSWVGRVDPAAVTWLSAKSDEWFQVLYALLNKHCEDSEDYGNLKETLIVRLTTGELVLPRRAFFLTGPILRKDPLARVSDGVLSAGTKKAQQEAARKFLEKVGVRVPGDLEEVTQLLKSRYGFEGEAPSDKTYVADMKRFIAFAERNPQSQALFAAACLFRVDAPEVDWAGASSVYVDAPFRATGLAAYYALGAGADETRWPLARWYLESALDTVKLLWFAVFAGCAIEFKKLFLQTNCYQNPKWSYLSSVAGERHSSPINIDYGLTKKAYEVLRTNNADFSRLVWATMCSAGSEILQARFRKNASSGSHYAPSSLVSWLRDLAWVPLKDGTFVTPRKAARSSLIAGFAVDDGFAWLKAVEFGADEVRKAADTSARAAKRAELGFKSEEELQQALAFSKLPPDERVRLLESSRDAPPEEVELPERVVPNAELRTRRVGEQAKQTAEKSSELRTRSVQSGYEAAKAEAKLYLTDQYTNRSGQMVCQICKGELPFKLPNGAYYFEAVDLLPDSPKRYRESFLALCPNHAAAYRFANAQRNAMAELVTSGSSNEVEVALGGEETTVYFTQMHLADIRAVLTAEEEERA